MYLTVLKNCDVYELFFYFLRTKNEELFLLNRLFFITASCMHRIHFKINILHIRSICLNFWTPLLEGERKLCRSTLGINEFMKVSFKLQCLLIEKSNNVALILVNFYSRNTESLINNIFHEIKGNACSLESFFK